MIFCKSLLLLAFVAGTWNLRWFPSGRSEHRASPRVEQANMSDAADVIRENLKGKNRVLFLQEMRSAAVCSNLVAAIGDENLRVASASAFRDFRDNRLQWQQVAILTDMPVLKSEFKYAKKSGGMFVPRGYAFALLDGGDEGKIACFCVHLKSNYGAKNPDVKAMNTAKREAMIEQIVKAARSVKADKIVVAGDFNADRFKKEFEDDTIFAILEKAGYKDGWNGAEASERGTHPGRGRYRDSTLDYVFCKGAGECSSRSLAEANPVSDHRMAVFEFNGGK